MGSHDHNGTGCDHPGDEDGHVHGDAHASAGVAGHAHSHGHAHAHGHGHAHGSPAVQGRAFLIGIVLNLGFVVIETGFGLAANSMALLADAGHNLSDVLALAVSWGAFRLSRRAPTARFTYGFRASSILAALFNGVVLLVACGALALGAIERLAQPPVVAGNVVALVALVGIGINLATALMFARGAKADLNVRGAFLHMASDAAVSAGVAIAGVVTARTGAAWIDPAVSLGIVVVILLGTWGLLREAVALALQAVPAGIDPAAVKQGLLGLGGVVDVHHLHIWPMSTTETALTAHLVLGGDAAPDGLPLRAQRLVASRFGIAHGTFQVERDDSGHDGLCRPE